MADLHKNVQIRKENYDLCREGKAPPRTQRIYDSFISKYPEALITGISISDNGNKLLVHLDGDPSYYVTFDPLTNSVVLTKYNDGSTAPVSRTNDAPATSSSGGCLMLLLKCVLVVVVIWFVSLLLSDISTGDVAPSNGTARVTARPTSTAPAEDIISWATYYARTNMPDDMSLDIVETSISVGETYLTIACNMDTMWDGKEYILSAARLIVNVIPGIRDKPGFDHVTFLFYGPFIDKYGNPNTSLGLRAMYSVSELQSINCTYFEDHLYSSPDAIFKLNRNYLIHPSYQD